MCVWQSHAPAGMAKLTGVAGCEGSANVDPARDRALAAIAPNTTSRLVVMMVLLVGLPSPPIDAAIVGRRNRGHECSRLRQDHAGRHRRLPSGQAASRSAYSRLL